MTLKQSLHDHAQAINETMKLSPPIAIAGTGFAGVDWQTWVLVLTAIYTILLILHKLFQIYRDVVRFNKGDPDSALGKLP